MNFLSEMESFSVAQGHTVLFSYSSGGRTFRVSVSVGLCYFCRVRGYPCPRLSQLLEVACTPSPPHSPFLASPRSRFRHYVC